MRMWQGEDGGTAVKERARRATSGAAKTSTRTTPDRGSLSRPGKTVSAVIRDSVGVGDMKFEGESEPRWDGSYGRQEIRLRREGDSFVNSIGFSFDASLDWPGPLVAFVVHDPDGKAVARSALGNPMKVLAGTTVSVNEGSASFTAIEREERP